MNRAFVASLSDFWHSTSFATWLTIIAAALFAVILVITLLRAEKSAANGALIVITLLAVGIAAVAMMRASSVTTAASDSSHPPLQMVGGLPALSCLDGLAGESVETACEKAVFASADSTAAAVSYVAAQISRLASYGNVGAADKVMTPELQALRRAIERDRYGLVAYVLTVRDGCNLSACPFFQSLTNTAQISINMTEKAYEGFVGQYLPSWNGPAQASASAPVATSALQPNAPTGKPLSGDFPASSTSIPPINIMAPEPAVSPPAPKTAEEGTSHTGAPAAKKPSAQKPRAQAPASLAPPAASDDN